MAPAPEIVPVPARVRRLGRVAAKALGGLTLVLVVVNLGIAALALVARADAPPPDLGVTGVDNLRIVDDRVLRGDAPSADGYRELAALGVTTVVDLRAEEELHLPEAVLAELHLDRIALPIRDGQTPRPDQVQAFLEIVDAADGLVYLHCGAGVGRTGAMTAAYLVATGQQSSPRALVANLSVGPPSIEQIWYAATLDGDADQPPAPIKALSRLFDGPRRLWSRFG